MLRYRGHAKDIDEMTIANRTQLTRRDRRRRS
jgi:hypothetical protein